jgi:hypothetical protein
MSKASDLVYEYVAAEKKIESAEKALLEAAEKKTALMKEITNHPALTEALMSTGVSQSGKILSLDCINGEYEMVAYDEPVNAYSIIDEPEEIEIFETDDHAQ